MHVAPVALAARTGLCLAVAAATASQAIPSGQTSCYDEAFAGDVDIATAAELPAAARHVRIDGTLLFHNTQLVAIPDLFCPVEVFHLHIDLSPRLASLSGLRSIRRVNGNLNVATTEVLADLRGLDSITTVGGQLFIAYNHGLRSLRGLDRLELVERDVFIHYGGALTNLDGLNALRRVGGNLSVFEEPALKNLSGLNRLKEVGGNVSINSNGSLTSLRGLDALESVGGTVYVSDNHMLPDCEVWRLVKRLRARRSDLQWNASGNRADGCSKLLARANKRSAPPPSP
ncbi:MAG: hypothetical protein JXR83_04360 [Deltaproteobacteria bacterium]|nr:hypothetical protein [Deltaproteobacteria bacterium]